MGALTLKAFSDELREWEFIENDGVDPTDGFGVNLRLSVRENQIFLAEPSNPSMPWLTDRGRLFFDGMFDTTQLPVNWESLFNSILESMYFLDHLNLKQKAAFNMFLIFETLSLESLNMLYAFGQSCSLIQLRQIEGFKSSVDLEANFQLSKSVEKEKLRMSTLAILLSVDSRHEGYVLNLELRQRFLKGNFKVFCVGPMLSLTFPSCNLGSNNETIKLIKEGLHLLCQDLKNSKFPVLITNAESFKRSDFKTVMSDLKSAAIVSTVWGGFNVLNPNLETVGIHSLKKFPTLSDFSLRNYFGLYFINVELAAASNFRKLANLRLLNLSPKANSLKYTISVDQSTTELSNKTSSEILQRWSSGYSDYFHLPSSFLVETPETYINTQGVVKRTVRAIHFKKNARSNWQITRKLYAKSKKIVFLANEKDNRILTFESANLLNFNNYSCFQFYASQSFTSLSSHLTKANKPMLKNSHVFRPVRTKVFHTKLKGWLDDFFNKNGKNILATSSSVLANCSKIARNGSTNFF